MTSTGVPICPRCGVDIYGSGHLCGAAPVILGVPSQWQSSNPNDPVSIDRERESHRAEVGRLLSQLRSALARAERAEARMDALRGWLVDHECKNDRCPFCRTLDLIAELEKP